MTELETALEWTDTPVPEVLRELQPAEQKKVVSYIEHVVHKKTDGLEELYQAIAMIVKYIPHFVVIPLMVEHIRPPIAAGVCRKMGVDQATGYANDLPVAYFSEVSKHLDDKLVAEIMDKMKKHPAERFIHYELQHHLLHMLDIAAHAKGKTLEIIARHVTLPEHENDLVDHPHREVIGKLRAMQR
ncbi:hypothetical protein CHL67_04180 [Prosthecochloris sp. GSB1]|uniref:hypothetical protein n=1 Tax=Prosthecochloris sp. GSB1 TaxID=281093 RepID=UPI000B8C92EB|nr:hypothetical protein [Prosthecochloris sp. GSB1]ASQ91619.1 hypothetical protein CHL67_04180 [Prosthecochloris sp. GSB1]